MDGSKVQPNRAGGGQRGPVEIRSLPSQGSRRAGTDEYEMLLAEGHYRCPHCRRAGVGDQGVTAKRMR
jgi:hypothetical protein